MKQITKITFALALIISLASCQSSKVGCYDFGAIDIETPKDINTNKADSKLVFTNVACKP